MPSPSGTFHLALTRLGHTFGDNRARARERQEIESEIERGRAKGIFASQPSPELTSECRLIWCDNLFSFSGLSKSTSRIRRANGLRYCVILTSHHMWVTPVASLSYLHKWVNISTTSSRYIPIAFHDTQHHSLSFM